MKVPLDAMEVGVKGLRDASFEQVRTKGEEEEEEKVVVEEGLQPLSSHVLPAPMHSRDACGATRPIGSLCFRKSAFTVVRDGKGRAAGEPAGGSSVWGRGCMSETGTASKDTERHRVKELIKFILRVTNGFLKIYKSHDLSKNDVFKIADSHSISSASYP
eukprot:766568-Hanusia_phi.AAC.4